MSEPADNDSRPVSPLALAAVLACLSLFLVASYFAYVRIRPAALFIPESAPAERLPSDQAWQATASARLAYLQELRGQQRLALQTYGWVDRKTGVARIPIDQAMDDVVARYGRSAQ